MPAITEASQIEEMKKLPQDGSWESGLTRERAGVLGRIVAGGCKLIERGDEVGGTKKWRLTKTGINKLAKMAV